MISIYLVIGAFTGLMAGLFGIGGGMIVIPALSTLFVDRLDIPQNIIMQMAVGTSLAIMIITSLSSLYTHHKNAGVRWDTFRIMLPGLLLGALAGSFIAGFLPSYFLQICFSIFLLIMGFRLIINRKSPSRAESISKKKFEIMSVIMGAFSSILGIGGGAMIVPFLLYTGMEMPEATGTSVACGLTIGIIATVGFMISGLLSHVSVPLSTGYIYWPAFCGVALASILFAPLGAMLVHKLPRDFLRRIFGIFLLIMAFDMIFVR